MSVPHPAPTHRARAAWWRGGLLVVWALASFGVAFFARDLTQVVAGWPINYWWMAQGGVLVFIAIVVGYAWAMNRQPDADDEGLDEPARD